MDGINYGRIFSDKHNKRFIIAIFALFILIFYGVFQLYDAKFRAKDSGAEEATGQDASVLAAQDSPQTSVIEFTQLPERVALGEKFIAVWLINSDEPKTVTHTAVHYGYESRPGTFSTGITPQAAGYEEFTPEFASGEYPIPNLFSSEILVTRKGSLYLRVHAVIDGKNYWTEEKQIRDVIEEIPLIVERK